MYENSRNSTNQHPNKETSLAVDRPCNQNGYMLISTNNTQLDNQMEKETENDQTKHGNVPS